MSTRFTNYLRKKRENPEFRKREKIAEVAADLRIQIGDSGITQHQLAEKLDISDQALSKKLSGSANLTLGTLFDLLDAMGKDFDLAIRDKGEHRISCRRELLVTDLQVDAIGQPFMIRSRGTHLPAAANDGWGQLTLLARA